MAVSKDRAPHPSHTLGGLGIGALAIAVPDTPSGGDDGDLSLTPSSTANHRGVGTSFASGQPQGIGCSHFGSVFDQPDHVIARLPEQKTGSGLRQVIRAGRISIPRSLRANVSSGCLRRRQTHSTNIALRRTVIADVVPMTGARIRSGFMRLWNSDHALRRPAPIPAQRRSARGTVSFQALTRPAPVSDRLPEGCKHRSGFLPAHIPAQKAVIIGCQTTWETYLRGSSR